MGVLEFVRIFEDEACPMQTCEPECPGLTVLRSICRTHGLVQGHVECGRIVRLVIRREEPIALPKEGH